MTLFFPAPLAVRYSFFRECEYYILTPIKAQVAVRAADMFSSSFADMPVNNPDNATNVTKEDMPVNNPDIAAGDAKAKMLVLKTDSTADTDEFFALQTPAGTPTTPAPPSMDKVTWVAYNLRARKVPYKPNTPTPGGRVSKHARRISSGPRANNTQVTTPRAQKLQRGLDRKLSARFQNAKFNRMAERRLSSPPLSQASELKPLLSILLINSICLVPSCNLS